MEFKYPPELHDQNDDYLLASTVMKYEPEITGEKQHNVRAKYFGAACPISRNLICSVLSKKHYVDLGQLLRFYLNRKMKLVTVHCAIRFNLSP